MGSMWLPDVTFSELGGVDVYFLRHPVDVAISQQPERTVGIAQCEDTEKNHLVKFTGLEIINYVIFV